MAWGWVTSDDRTAASATSANKQCQVTGGGEIKEKKRNDVYKWMQCGIQYTVFVFVSLIKVLIESLINVECAFCSFRRKIKWSPQCLTLPVWFQHQALSANLYPSAGATEIFLVVLQIFCAMYISETFKMLPWKKKKLNSAAASCLDLNVVPDLANWQTSAHASEMWLTQLIKAYCIHTHTHIGWLKRGQQRP